ncbi:MAG: 3-hydroxyacyl-[acyl-carrier-protein] dehydratase FabZ [Legionellales bacterium]|jgi:3-hydroxyacyl-[acyl-carrier-protein] dehydratase|nr:3-hydroxyacyl-[acyl-carrier-protein] dehydratase FabZ [Legionellales bacterium]OUX63759.1 MAG: 3-hydroxyacyl-[acyl-carrier-protein] dehydratase FabZ [Gammaproteobacteria bacterium TMED281]
MSLLELNEIKEILPHRYPFLLVDRVINWVPGESITTLKNVTINEPFFEGHFPQKPIMPGMLIVEGIAQSGIIMVSNLIKESNIKDPLFYLAGIEKVKFRKMVTPGDQLIFDVKLLKHRAQYLKCFGEAKVDGELVCQAEILSVAQ